MRGGTERVVDSDRNRLAEAAGLKPGPLASSGASITVRPVVS